ncbi:MAG: ABC transporter substrate-binding protein [Ruminococcus sp.]|nr:ABC transporter substrate-binding protein [Ruminococcus sp.]
MKKLIIFIITAALLLTGCAKTDGGSAVYTFTDSQDRTVEVKSFEKTAVLSGSLAEVWQLAGGELFGITNDAYDGHTLDIPEDVKNYGDVKNPSVEGLIADGVDFVILSGTIANQVKLEETLNSSGITAAYFDVENFEDYLSMLKICTDITGRSDLYAENGEAVRERVEQSVERAKDKEHPKVLLLRSYSTGIKAKGSDNMTGQMLADLGCENIADSESSLLEELSLEAIVRADPDFVFITTMGGDTEAAIAQYEETLGSNPAWQELTAVKDGRVHILPKDMFHYKPNNRWGEAYEYLEEILYGGK